MGVTYYKRYRMEVDLRREWRRPPLPAGYRYAPWSDDRLEDHAETKHHAFRGEVDASVFPCLGELSGCEALMREIASRPGFSPEATWLVEYAPASGPAEAIGAVQGIIVTPRYGSLQNVGVTPWGRGRGIGRALVIAALEGFRDAGLQMASLEATAANTPAVRLYQSLGFHRVGASYRAVEVAVA